MAGRPRKVYPGEGNFSEDEIEEIKNETFETETEDEIEEKELSMSELDQKTISLLDELIENLAKTESVKRNAGKPHRYAFFTRVQLDRLSMNFKKSIR
jgi:hypothetical protein